MKPVRSWLIQRLQLPFKSDHPWSGKDNPFSFGGGFKNGGLSNEAMDVIRPVFRFDYMGAAEFEFGAVPEALQKISESRAEYVPGEVRIKPEEVESPPLYDQKCYRKLSKVLPVWYFCHKDHQDHVKALVRKLASGKGDGRSDLKEPTGLSRSLWKRVESEESKLDHRAAGWLELDNGFFFFVDEEMFTKTVRLFSDAPKS